MPPTSRGSCGDLHSSLWQLVAWSSWVWTGRGGCNPLWVLLPPWDWPLGRPTSPKTGAIWPLQVDLEQQLGHLWQELQNSVVIYTGNIFHTLYSLTVITITGIYTFLLHFFSFFSDTLWQKEQDLQHKSFYVNLQSRSYWSSPCFWLSLVKGSNFLSVPDTQAQSFSPVTHFTQ